MRLMHPKQLPVPVEMVDRFIDAFNKVYWIEDMSSRRNYVPNSPIATMNSLIWAMIGFARTERFVPKLPVVVAVEVWLMRNKFLKKRRMWEL
jgi:hypothetical protein